MRSTDLLLKQKEALEKRKEANVICQVRTIYETIMDTLIKQGLNPRTFSIHWIHESETEHCQRFLEIQRRVQLLFPDAILKGTAQTI
jgi:hypothetical protein